MVSGKLRSQHRTKNIKQTNMVTIVKITFNLITENMTSLNKSPPQVSKIKVLYY